VLGLVVGGGLRADLGLGGFVGLVWFLRFCCLLMPLLSLVYRSALEGTPSKILFPFPPLVAISSFGLSLRSRRGSCQAFFLDFVKAGLVVQHRVHGSLLFIRSSHTQTLGNKITGYFSSTTIFEEEVQRELHTGYD
jgi:hypothetical protein